MSNNEKAGVAAALIGAFALGWWLHKAKPAGGGVNLHFNPNAMYGTSLLYDVLDSSQGTILNMASGPRNVALAPGDYTVDITEAGG
jgi:hypothetical protein